MKDDYWALFRATGMPMFYLLYRCHAEHGGEAKTAWCQPQTKLV